MAEERPEQLIRAGYRYAFTLTGSRALAEDLTHDAWIASQRRWLGPSKAYLFRAIRHRFIDYRRGAATRLEVIETDLTDGPGDSADLDGLLADRARLAAAWQRISAPEREVLFLWAVEGFSAREIAQQIGSNRNSVLSRLQRAKARLRLKLRIAAKRSQDATAT